MRELNRHLETSLTSNSSLRITVVFSAIHADPSRISRARAFPRSWMGSPNVFILSALACLALMMCDDEYSAVFQLKRLACSIASWASATIKLSVSVLIAGSYLIEVKSYRPWRRVLHAEWVDSCWDVSTNGYDTKRAGNLLEGALNKDDISALIRRMGIRRGAPGQ